jgi:hypothetical protein
MQRAAADSGAFEETPAPAEQRLVVDTQPGQAVGKKVIPSVALVAKPPTTKSRTKRKVQRRCVLHHRFWTGMAIAITMSKQSRAFARERVSANSV